MTDGAAESYHKSPQFLEAMQSFQQGEWEKGFSQINDLVTQYPLEHDLRALRQEMQVRSRVDEYERQDRSRQRRRALRNWAARLMVVVVLLGSMYLVVNLYSNWMKEQFSAASLNITNQVKALDVTVKFRNATNLIYANRPAEARDILSEIAKTNPDYPGLPETLAQAERQVVLNDEYQKAIDLKNQGDPMAALDALEALDAEEPNYRDVPQLIDQLKRSDLLNELLSSADVEYENQQWQKAISDYESLRALDPTFNGPHVEERLYASYTAGADQIFANPAPTLEELQLANDYFRKALAIKPRDPVVLQKQTEARNALQDRLVASYLKLAQEALVGQGDSLSALDKATQYLNLALGIKPNDPTITKQLQLAQYFVQGQDAFNHGLWDNSIDDLENVYAEDQDYADGTARQILYESYVGRGNNYVASGQYDKALKDFQRAAVIAQQSPGSILRMLESQVMVADTMVLLGYYQDAARVYQAAVESSGLRGRTSVHKSDLLSQLDRADGLVQNGSYRAADLVFSQSLHNISDLYSTTKVTVTGSDYLAQLARKYNSTVQAILEANGLQSKSSLPDNLEITIPYLP